MKEKIKYYNKKMTRVKHKENSIIVKKKKNLREKKSKDPKSYWKIIKVEQGNKETELALDAFYDHFRVLLTDDDDDMNDRNRFRFW